MAIQVTFETLVEDQPGAPGKPCSSACGRAIGPGSCAAARSIGRAICNAGVLLREHMPELVPTWERLVELAGGGDVEARFLSMWCPPRYITGCSQAVWVDPAGAAKPALLRNYDFAPALLEGTWLATRWLGPRVIAMGDCLWGALDGLNEAWAGGVAVVRRAHRLGHRASGFRWCCVMCSKWRKTLPRPSRCCSACPSA
jgi:hypothetical protein